MVFALALVLGCISPAAPPQENNSVANTSSCRTVVTNEPYNDTACQNVSSMGQVCDTVVLNYSVSNTAKSEICVDKSLCAATDAFGNCISYYCSQGMTRCSVNITNMARSSIRPYRPKVKVPQRPEIMTSNRSVPTAI